jgi:hypothetical protein
MKCPVFLTEGQYVIQLIFVKMDLEKANKIIFVLVAVDNLLLIMKYTKDIVKKSKNNVLKCMLMEWDLEQLRELQEYIIQR